jgi:hypothetical protein
MLDGAAARLHRVEDALLGMGMGGDMVRLSGAMATAAAISSGRYWIASAFSYLVG